MLFFKIFVRDSLADDKLKLLGYEGIGVREILLCYIANSPVMNYMYRTEQDPYSDAEVAQLLSIELQRWLQIKERLLTYGGMKLDDKKAIGFPKFSERQSDYYRQKKYRISKKKVTTAVTDGLRAEVRSKKLEVRSKITTKPPIVPQTAGDIVEVITYLNHKAKRSFRTDTPAFCKHINARLKEGATIELMKKVIDLKVWDWLEHPRDTGMDMSQYLTPDTLFNSAKFWKYAEDYTRRHMAKEIKKDLRDRYVSEGQQESTADVKARENSDELASRRIQICKEKFGHSWWKHMNDKEILDVTL